MDIFLLPVLGLCLAGHGCTPAGSAPPFGERAESGPGTDAGGGPVGGTDAGGGPVGTDAATVVTCPGPTPPSGTPLSADVVVLSPDGSGFVEVTNTTSDEVLYVFEDCCYGFLPTADVWGASCAWEGLPVNWDCADCGGISNWETLTPGEAVTFDYQANGAFTLGPAGSLFRIHLMAGVCTDVTCVEDLPTGAFSF